MNRPLIPILFATIATIIATGPSISGKIAITIISLALLYLLQKTEQPRTSP